MNNPFRQTLLLVSGALLAFSPALCNAQAYKCTENGSTVYQSQPCKSAGKLVHVDAGPSEQSAEEARIRAEKDKQTLDDVTSQQRDQQAMNRGSSAVPANCAKINQEVADAQAEYDKLVREGGMAGATPQGIRNNNQQAMAAQQRLGNAKQNASVFGCTQQASGPNSGLR